MEKPNKILASTSLALSLAFAHTAQAEISWNGFLSAGGGFANPDDDAETLLDYEEDLTFSNETILGLQLRGSISDKLSATGQLVARGEENYEADMAWAYLSYEASDSTTLRLGRLRTPFYLYSDFLEVGYAYHWIAPPTSVYALPSDTVDGFDLVYNKSLGSVDTTLQVYGGSINDTVDIRGAELDSTTRGLAGIVATLNYDWFTFRISHHEAQKASFDGLQNIFIAEEIGTIGDLADSLNALALATGDSGYSDAAANLFVDEVKYTYDELALKAEWNNILAVTEFTRLNGESGPFDTQNRMYFTLGYTFGAFMVHATQEKTDDDVATISSTIPTDIPGTELNSAILASVVDGIATSFASPSTTINTLGIRWDFEAGAAFKAEYSDVDNDTGESGNLLRFTVDLVF